MFLDSTLCNQLKMFFVSLRLGWELNRTWLITELANQRVQKALFTCVVYLHTPRPRWKGFSKLATSKKPIGIMTLKLFLYELFYILMQIKFIYTRKVLHLELF